MSLRSSRAIVILVIVLVAATAGACQRRQAPVCSMCSKEIPARTSVALVSSSGDTSRVCCARCALLFTSRAAGERGPFRSIATRDYETGDAIELTAATFVYKSDIVPCCVPSIIVLGNLEQAQDFSAHAGGMILDYDGVRAALALEAGGRCQMCSKPMSHQAARPCVLLLASDESHVTCCPHCAFVLERMLDEPDTELEIFCTDDDHLPYRAGEETRFVAESDVPVCCRPMLVPCRSLEGAEIVVSRHGGRILTIDEARELVHQHDHQSGKKAH